MTTEETTTTEAVYPPPVELGQDLGLWLKRFRDLKAQADDIEEMMKNARSKIEEAMGESETATLDGVPVVSWKHVETERLDVKKVRAALTPEVFAQFAAVTKSRRFSLLAAK